MLRAASRDPFYATTVHGTTGVDLAAFPFSGSDPWLNGRNLPKPPACITHPLNRRILATAVADSGGACAALAGSASALLARTRDARPPQPECAVLVLERPGDRELSETERDDLWDAYQVPVFRLLVGFDGILLAHECEALAGLHATGHAIFEEHAGSIYVTSLSDLKNPLVRLHAGLAVRIEHTPCDCGRPGLRLAPAWREFRDLSSAAD